MPDLNITLDWNPILTSILAGIFAFFGSWFAARINRDTQVKTAAQDTFISARLNAYLSFEEIFARWAKEKSRDSFAAIYQAENVVRLVGSERTILKLGKLTEYVRRIETTNEAISFDELSKAHAAVLLSMRNDLVRYPIPKPESK